MKTIARTLPDIGLSGRMALLERHLLFQALGPEVRERLANYASIRTVPRGTTVFAKGDGGTALFAVFSGTVQITAPSLNGKSAVYNHIAAGDVFGEIALLDGGPRTADAVAFTDCTLMVIERRDFLSVLTRYPEVSMKVIEVLCARLRHTTEQVQDLMFLDLKGRLVKTLLRLWADAENGHSLALSQTDLSNMVGMSREMINKQLQVWAKAGWIRLDRRSITLVQPDALRCLVGER